MCGLVRVLCVSCAVMAALCVAAPASAEEGASAPAEAAAPTEAAKELTEEEWEARGRILGRAELVFVQAVHGLVVASELHPDQTGGGGEAWLLGGMALGGGLAYLLTMDGITLAHTRSINWGMFWTAVNVEWTLARQRDEQLITLRDERGLSQSTQLWMMAGQFVGMGLGHLYYTLLEPSAGQVSLISSGGLWFTVGSVLISGEDGDAFDLVAPQIAMNAGLVLGGVLAHSYPMSYSRVLLLDLAGIGGLLGGYGFYTLANDQDRGGLGPMMAVGAALGIGLSAYLTRDWDDDDEDVQRRRNLPNISLVPGDAIAPVAGEHQGGFGVSASWAW